MNMLVNWLAALVAIFAVCLWVNGYLGFTPSEIKDWNYQFAGIILLMLDAILVVNYYLVVWLNKPYPPKG